MTGASFRFRCVYGEDLDNVLMTISFKLKQLDYSLSISMRNSGVGLQLRHFSRNRNLELKM